MQKYELPNSSVVSRKVIFESIFSIGLRALDHELGTATVRNELNGNFSVWLIDSIC